MRSFLTSALTTATLALSLTAGTVEAQAYLTSNRLGYTGTITRYNSYVDALFGFNAVPGSPFAVPQRDLGMFMIDNNQAFSGAGYPPSAFDFLTFWYSKADGSAPSNQNLGFVQLADEDGGSVIVAEGKWNNAALTSFSYTATGGATTPGCGPYNPTIVEDCARLWNAGSAIGSAETTAGAFINYQFSLTVGGLTPATFNPITGVFESNSDPATASGFFRGLFYNYSLDDPTSNGFYAVDLSINMNSWAAGQDQNSLDVPAIGGSVWGATAVPEPASFLLIPVGLLGLAFAARRRRLN